MPVERVVRVLPDEAAINKTFDYLVPAGMAGADLLRLGTMVRFPLHGRRVGGWVVGIDVEPATPREKLKPITRISSYGPPRELLSLSKWAAWRWWGRPATFLATASPKTNVRALPRGSVVDRALLPLADSDDPVAALAREALVHDALAGDEAHSTPPSVVRVPPTADVFGLVLEAVRHGGADGTVVVTSSLGAAVQLARRLRRAGAPVALLPDDWARAAAGGCVVIGARATAWAPIARPGAFVVLDEHDEVHKEERAPAWHVRDVCVERARRLGVPCLLVSPVPSLEALAIPGVRVLAPPRAIERAGWPMVEVIDRGTEEPGRQGAIAPSLVGRLRTDPMVVCVLNRVGRARLLACASCGTLARCERCHGAVQQPVDADRLVCEHCHAERPVVCASCGGGRLKNLRKGVTRLREELEVLALRPVVEITGTSDPVPDGVHVVVGTEAALHRVDVADTIVFLELDGELLAPRYRAGEQVLALLVHAARLVGGRTGAGRDGGRVVLQTRLPQHEVILAAVLGDPTRHAEQELERRAALGFPPAVAMAEVSGAGAAPVAEALRSQTGISVIGPPDGPFLVRAADHTVLCDALASVERPTERVRVEVDPLRC